MHGQKDLMYGSNKILSNPSEVGRLHFILTFIVFKNQQHTYIEYQSDAENSSNDTERIKS